MQDKNRPTTPKRRAPKTAFKPGQSGNPRGKARGTLSHAARILLNLMQGGAEEITKAVIDQAKSGNLVAARLILERIVPPAKERPISISLPDISTIDGITQAQAAILQAVAEGELLPGEAATLTGIVENRRKAIETEELEKRIAALEEKQ